MNIDKLIKPFAITVKDEHKIELSNEIARTNLTRGRIISLLIIVMELFVIIFSLLSGRVNIFEEPTVYYYSMYIMMIIFMLVMLIILSRFSKQKKLHTGKLAGMTYTYTTFVLVWSMGITLLDQSRGGSLISYFIALIAISVIIYIKPKILLLIYMSVHTAFIILLPFFLPAGQSPFGAYVNTTITVLISCFIGYVIYKSKVRDFAQKKIIEKKNEQLSVLNDKLTETNKTLEYLSQTDGLTGISNRRMFDKFSNDYWNSCLERGAALTVVMMDIDHFKEYNDNFGHQAGDDCLIALVNSLKKSIGSKEIMLARYGGEEFVLMVCGITKNASYALAEKIRKNVVKLSIKRKYKKVAEHITLSLGVYCGMPTGESDVKEFIKMADKALYAAKRDKRNNTKMLE